MNNFPFFHLTLFTLERAMGIEPTTQAWEARILPLNYARIQVVLYSFWLIIQLLKRDNTAPFSQIKLRIFSSVFNIVLIEKYHYEKSAFSFFKCSNNPCRNLTTFFFRNRCNRNPKPQG